MLAARAGPAQAPSTKRCAVYTRKSTDEGLEQEFNSLDAQREAAEAFIASQRHEGWECLSTRYDDGGYTGANTERPALKRLLADIERGGVDVVIVYKVDRLSRSLLDFAKLMELFERHAVEFVSVTQQFNTATSMGRLVLNVLLSFAQFERELISERTRDKVRASRRRGRYTGGRAPIGYEARDKKLVVNAHEGEVVREIFRLYEVQGSALVVAQMLNTQGCTTKHYRSKNGREQKGSRWTKDAVLRILQNPIYAGLVRQDAELHDGEHEPIIDRDQFNRVQALLDAQGGTRQDQGRNPEYLLRGILRCAHCGMAMTPASSKGRNGRTYRYYRCITKDKHGARACAARPLPADAIEGFVIEKIRVATADGNLAQDVVRSLEDRIQRQRRALLAERRVLVSKTAGISAQGGSMAEQLASLEGTARRLLEARIEEIGKSLAEHEAHLVEVEKGLAALAKTEIEARWVAQAIEDFDIVWDAMTPQNRARLVRALVERVEVDERAGTVTAVLVDLGANRESHAAARIPEALDHASP